MSLTKHLYYIRYIAIHKWFVMLACFHEGLFWQGLTHDLSKFLPSEWAPYANSFYGPWDYADRPVGVSDAFDRAWLLHQHRNPHHWQYWCLREDDGDLKALPMPKAAVKEMLCDWYGAGRAIQGASHEGWKEVARWYSEQSQVLHESTRWEIRRFLLKRGYEL